MHCRSYPCTGHIWLQLTGILSQQCGPLHAAHTITHDLQTHHEANPYKWKCMHLPVHTADLIRLADMAPRCQRSTPVRLQ